MGVIESQKLLNHSPEMEPVIKDILNEFITLQNNHIEKMKEYLQDKKKVLVTCILLGTFFINLHQILHFQFSPYFSGSDAKTRCNAIVASRDVNAVRSTVAVDKAEVTAAVVSR